MKKYLSLTLLLTFAVILAFSFVSGCKKDKGDPPVLPPAETMLIDFSLFESGKKSADESAVKGVDPSNWAFAALVAGYWKTILYVNLAVPVSAFEHAAATKPVYLESKTWQWSYDAPVTLNNVTSVYKARLVGQITATEVLWKMYISKTGTGAFDEFIWFEGSSKLDGKSGKWTLNYNSQFPEPVLEIDWSKADTNVGSIKYTYVRTLNNARAADTFKGSYIGYGLTTNTLNAFYDIHYFNGSEFSNVNVEWSTSSHNGRVKSLVHFGNDNWYCWNANLINAVCP